MTAIELREYVPGESDIGDIVFQCAQDSIDWFPETANDIAYITLAMFGEAGEFGNKLKKVIRGDKDINDPDFRLEINLELVDIFIYLCNLAALLGIDLKSAYEYKREINVNRFKRSEDVPSI